MAAQRQIPVQLKDSANTATEIGVVLLTPLKARNGIYEYTGAMVSGTVYPSAPMRMSVSVRPGLAANYITKAQRVKQRTTQKLSFPVEIAGEFGPVIDYINLDLVLSAPIGVSENQIFGVLHTAAYAGFFDSANNPLRDLLVNGNEPY